MKVRILFAMCLVPLGGCMGSLLNDNDSWAYQKTQELNANSEAAGKLGREMAKEALAKGAMHPLDRIEVDIYRAYQDAKYPETAKEKPK